MHKAQHSNAVAAELVRNLDRSAGPENVLIFGPADKQIPLGGVHFLVQKMDPKMAPQSDSLTAPLCNLKLTPSESRVSANACSFP